MVASIVSPIGIPIGSIEAAGVVHVEGRRGGVGVDDLAGRVHLAWVALVVHAGVVGLVLRYVVAWRHPIGGNLVIVARRGGHLLAWRRTGRAGGHLSQGGRVRAGGVVHATSMGHVGYVWLGAV